MRKVNMKKAYALSVILWIVAGMGAVTIFLAILSKDIVGISAKLEDKLISRLKAEETVDLLIFYGTTGEFYLNTMTNQIAEDYNLSNKLYIDNNNTIFNDVNITIQDTAGIYNVLFLRNEMIAKELDIENFYTIKDSILDWIDKNSFQKLNGAEEDYYRHLSDDSYKPRDDLSIQAVEELALIKGIEKSRLDELRSLFYYGRGSKANLMTIPKKSLIMLLDITPSFGDELINLREKEPLEFIKSINRLDSKVKDEYDSYGFFPSKIIKINILASHKDARTKIEAVLDFKMRQERAFIYNYKVY